MQPCGVYLYWNHFPKMTKKQKYEENKWNKAAVWLDFDFKALKV